MPFSNSQWSCGNTSDCGASRGQKSWATRCVSVRVSGRVRSGSSYTRP